MIPKTNSVCRIISSGRNHGLSSQQSTPYFVRRTSDWQNMRSQRNKWICQNWKKPASIHQSMSLQTLPWRCRWARTHASSHAHGIKLSKTNRTQQQPPVVGTVFFFSSLLFAFFNFSPLFGSSSHQLIESVTLSQDYLNLWKLRFMLVERNCIRLKIEWPNWQTQRTVLISKYWIKGISISLTLAFWNGRPRDSSFMSTVDVLISMGRIRAANIWIMRAII